MATIRQRTEQLHVGMAYHLVRRAQAAIAAYRHFGQGDLSKYLERDAFGTLAQRIAEYFFSKSRNLAIFGQVLELYRVLLVMAPILQRLPLSAHFDWHLGHILGWFRRNATGRVQRFYFQNRCLEMGYQPGLLEANLETLGIHDGGMVAILLDLYRRHAGGVTLKDRLAHQLFDPILMSGAKSGYELRIASGLYRLEKSHFEHAIDLRERSATVLEFVIHTVENRKGWHLEIQLSEARLAKFRADVKRILNSTAAPVRKVLLIEGCIRDFMETARWARSARPQMDELRRWLANKLRPLAATLPEANHLPGRLTTLWFQRVDGKLYVKEPNFFLDPKLIEEKTYIVFFSPFREVMS